MEKEKLKSLNEWGILKTLKIAAKSAAKTAGAATAKAAAKIATKAPKILRTGAVEGAKGVAVETGFEASKEYHEHQKIKDERAELRAERKRLKELERHHTNESTNIHVTPPVVLVLKRKSIRLFPQGDKIALYRNDKLGVNFAIPYDDGSGAASGRDALEPIIGTVAEGKLNDLGRKAGGAAFKFLRKRGWIIEKPPESEEEIEALKKAASRLPHISADVKSQGRAIVGATAGAIGVGYLANKGFKKLRDKSDKPSNKTIHGGRAVYESNGISPKPAITYYRASARQYAKLGALAGLGFAAGKTAFDVAKDVVSSKKEKFEKDKKKYVHHVKEGKTQAYQLMKLAFEPEPMISKNAKRATIAAAIGAGLATANARAERKERNQHHKKVAEQAVRILSTEEAEQLNEFLPILAGLAARVGAGVLARTAAVRAATSTAISAIPPAARAVGKFVGGQAIIGGTAGAAEGALKRKPVPRSTNGSNPSPQPTAKYPDNENNDNDENVSEGTMQTRTNVKVLKSIKIPKGMGKEFAKAAAVAAGTVAVQKTFDAFYDKWRDKKEIELAAKEERAKARERAKVSGKKKIIVKKVVKPHSTTTVTKQIKEERKMHEPAFHTIRKMASGELGYGPVRHDNGKKTSVDAYTAQAIMAVHKHLKPENQIKLEGLVNRDRSGLVKVADFSFRQLNNQ